MTKRWRTINFALSCIAGFNFIGRQEYLFATAMFLFAAYWAHRSTTD